MSGDNLHGKQPNIRYNVDVHHHEEWEEMSFSEKMKIITTFRIVYHFITRILVFAYIMWKMFHQFLKGFQIV